MRLSRAREILREYGNDCGRHIPEIKEAVDTVLGTEDEPTFILLTRDPLAANEVRNWIWSYRLRRSEKVPQDEDPKLISATDVLNKMYEYSRKHSGKMEVPG